MSGHSSAEELKLMLNLVSPDNFMPIHGEMRHLHAHAHLATAVGIPEQNVWVLDNGDCLEIDEDGVHLGERVNSGVVYVDGLAVGDLGQVVLRDRQALSSDGFALIVVAIDSRTGAVVGDPELVTRGLVLGADTAEALKGARARIDKVLKKTSDEGATDEAVIKKALHDAAVAVRVGDRPPPPDDHPGRHGGVGGHPRSRSSSGSPRASPSSCRSRATGTSSWCPRSSAGERFGLGFDVVLHAATLLATIAYFRADVWRLLTCDSSRKVAERARDRRLALVLIVATIPSVDRRARRSSRSWSRWRRSPMASQVTIVGVFLLVTAALLAGAELIARRSASTIAAAEDDPAQARARSIGVAQGFAVAPGLSRSGTTIAAGVALGIERDEAARFSFLLSDPDHRRGDRQEDSARRDRGRGGAPGRRCRSPSGSSPPRSSATAPSRCCSRTSESTRSGCSPSTPLSPVPPYWS